MSEKVKLGIIGIGNQGSTYARRLARENWVPDIQLVAIADINPDRIAWARENVSADIAYFDDALAMLDSGLLDACVVSVPHYDHPKYVIECLRRGIHVLCEKPAGVYTEQVREMNAEAEKHPETVFAMMFNQRTNCVYRKMRELIQSGRYGRVRRANWLITNWYRSQYYYDSGDWRATWSGEGGGVLLNQAPHNLDLWQWICGMPSELTAWCDVAKYHHIEVEDEATIFVRYPGGATGAFITSTGESPGTNRLEISGTRGKIVLEEGKLKFWRLKEDEARARFESGESMPHLPLDYEEWTPDTQGSGHAGILRNFADAVLHGAELLSPAEDGLFELMLSNAAYLSAWEGSRTVALPADEERFNRLLAERQLSSRRRDSASGLGKEVTGEYAERWQTRW